MSKDVIQYTNFFSIFGFMTAKDGLALTGVKLQIYAIIYSFTHNGRIEFEAPLDYIAEFTGSCRRSITQALSELVDKGFILKTDRNTDKGKTNAYRVNLDVVKKLLMSACVPDVEETPLDPRMKAKKEFMKEYPRFSYQSGYDDSKVDYEILLREFKASTYLRKKIKSMKLVCKMYATEIAAGIHRDEDKSSRGEHKMPHLTPQEQAANERVDRERYYAALRENAQRVACKNEEKARSNPEFKRVEAELSSAVIEEAKAEVRMPKKLPELLRKLKELQQKRQELLKSMNLSDVDLTPQYKCKKCDDTGFMKKDGRGCDCYAPPPKG